MVVTKWSAVAIGLGITLVLSFASGFVPAFALLGGAVAGLLGGWTAGYYARSGRLSGAWNGLLAGSVGGLVAMGLLLLAGLAVSVAQLSLGGVFATLGVVLSLLVLVLFHAIPATLGGLLGGMYPREEPEETRQPVA
ncbi:DUF5518 domain-containing protein [Haloferax sp. YSMS24]|uniref:DUF5518 domain-containing protein n=1 Tax=unclassified Haloferax TaxID=2625095 RepID=UPI00398C9876